MTRRPCGGSVLLQSRGFVLKLVCHSVPCGIWNNSDNMFVLESWKKALCR